MPEARERILIAATPKPVEAGQKFDTIPPHMTLIGWLMIHNDRDLQFVDDAVAGIFEHDYFQKARIGKKVHFGVNNDVEARLVNNIEHGPWYGLHALSESLGLFPENDAFTEVFSPHITKAPGYIAWRGRRVAFASLAIFSRQLGQDAPTTKEVHAAYSLGKYRHDKKAA